MQLKSKLLLFSAHVYKIEGKSFCRRLRFFKFTSQLHDFAKLLASEFENFLFSKFAGECNWNSEVSQIRTKFGYFQKFGFFEEEHDF